jgi:hypothetical protein
MQTSTILLLASLLNSIVVARAPEPGKLATTGRLDLSADTKVGSIDDGEVLVGSGSVSRMNWIPESDRTRSYTINFAVSYTAWREVLVRFIPRSTGTLTLTLMGPWEEASKGVIYRQEVLWDAIAVEGTALENGGFESGPSRVRPVGHRVADLLVRTAEVRTLDKFYDRAFSLLTTTATRQACDLTSETPQVRDRYGRNSFGQGCLLARRLVEAVVSLVTVNWARDDAFWDTHKDNFKDLKTKLLPPFDLGFSALLEDLAQRGLLDETLVVCLAEFGRTPKINAAAGRDHWAQCFSVVLAGAGIRGGQVYGASDRIAAYPTDRPVSPADLAATVYSALGVDTQTEIRDRIGRPFVLSTGQPIAQLF